MNSNLLILLFLSLFALQCLGQFTACSGYRGANCTACASPLFPSICAACSPGYYMSESLCIPQSITGQFPSANTYYPICSTYTSAGICTACPTGYYLTSGYCKACNTTTNLQNCLQCTTTGQGQQQSVQCTQYRNNLCNNVLQVGQIDMGNNCQYCIYAPATTTTWQCTACSSNQMVLVPIPPVAPNTITQCSAYAPATPPPAYCSNPASYNNCFQCALVSGNCVSCNPGYYVTGAFACAACPTNCATCTISACLTCTNSSYYASGNTCAACSSSCPLGCSGTSTTCTSCPDGFFLTINSTCVACTTYIQNCTRCALVNGTGSVPTCFGCAPNMHASLSNTCESSGFLDTYCLIGSLSYCAVCAGPTVPNNQCIKCPTYCATCNTAINCTSCAAGLIKPLNSTMCKNFTNYAYFNLSPPQPWQTGISNFAAQIFPCILTVMTTYLMILH
jgi:proprotein convertase subtilisin/kexin type 5